MNRIERVVVDECVGQESPIVGQLRQRLGERPVKFVFLATEHPGIPDIEILDKLLDVRSALLTQDRVLHNLAIGHGFQSFVHTPESGLTDRRLVHVSAPDKHLPVASGALRDSYQHQSNPEAQAITECLYSFLSAHQLKQFRTKRRRIRAHFGSPDNIAAAALTIGQRRTAQRAAASSSHSIPTLSLRTLATASVNLIPSGHSSLALTEHPSVTCLKREPSGHC